MLQAETTNQYKQNHIDRKSCAHFGKLEHSLHFKDANIDNSGFPLILNLV